MPSQAVLLARFGLPVPNHPNDFTMSVGPVPLADQGARLLSNYFGPKREKVSPSSSRY
jgi:hypothetical protein